MTPENQYTLDYLLNYCEDSNISPKDVKVIVEEELLLMDLQKYEDTVDPNKAFKDFVKGK